LRYHLGGGGENGRRPQRPEAKRSLPKKLFWEVATPS
jgi:hypothetical protein